MDLSRAPALEIARAAPRPVAPPAPRSRATRRASRPAISPGRRRPARRTWRRPRWSRGLRPPLPARRRRRATSAAVPGLDRRRRARARVRPRPARRVRPAGAGAGHARAACPRCPRSRGRPAGRPWPTSPRSTGRGSTPTARPAPTAPGPAPRASRPSSAPSTGSPATRTPTAAGTARTAQYDDGTAVKGDDDFTVHCPPGETCFGECIYWEADTALTGLALLAYLGAGLHPDRRQVRRDRRQGARLPARSAEARRRPPGPEPGRRHVLPRDGHARALRGLRPDRRRAAPRPGRAGRRRSSSAPAPATAWPGGTPRRPGRRHEHPGLGGHGLEVGQARSASPSRPRVQAGTLDLARQGRQRRVARAWPATSPGRPSPRR